MVFKVIGYALKGSNSAILRFASLVSRGKPLKEKKLLLKEQILSFKCNPCLEKFDGPGKQTLCKNGGKIWRCTYIHLDKSKCCSYNLLVFE